MRINLAIPCPDVKINLMKNTKTKTTLNENRTFTVTLQGKVLALKPNPLATQKREVETYCLTRAIQIVQDDIRDNWSDKSVRVIAVREGPMFTPEVDAEMKREKDEWRSR
jgi:hypothetical protein